MHAIATLVIMLHGAGGGGWEYDLWKPVFEKQGYQVIARDLVSGPRGLAATTLADYVDEAAAWIPAKHGPIVIVGASMGGAIALKLAKRVHPQAVVLVDSVVPAGVGPARAPEKHPAIIEWAHGPLKDTTDSMPDSDAATQLWAWPKWRNESGAVMDELSNGVPCFRPTCPTLSVLGEDDTDVGYAPGLALAAWAHADIRAYQGMSHVGPLMSRRAAEVASDVTKWLRSRGL